MKRVWRLVILGCVVLGALTVVPSSQAGLAHKATYAYGKHARQKLDAYWYRSHGTQPGLVLLHGGYWQSGSRTEWRSAAEWFAAKGFAVFAVDYRYSGDAVWPAQRNDVQAAVRWIKAHAASFKVDPNRLAVMGAQAGGQLASQLGGRVRGVVGLSPIADPAQAYATSTGRLRDQVVILANCAPGFGATSCAERLTDMGAAAHAGRTPHYLVYSERDAVPQVESARLATNDREVTVQTVGGDGSGGALLNGVRDRVLRWLRAKTAPRAETERVTAPLAAPDPATTAPPLTARFEAAGEQRDLAYGSAARQRIDVYAYRSARPRPAILMIHGGYWYEGDKSAMAEQARWYAAQGYAVFSMNYRLATQARWPAQREDVQSALAWIRDRTATYAVDPRRIVLFGSSAGGHMATNLGTYGDARTSVKAVVALSPVADAHLAYTEGRAEEPAAQRGKLRDTAALLLGCTPDRADRACWSRWADAASQSHAGATDVPMYLLHGQDDFVPSAHSLRLCERLRAAGVECSVRTVPGHKHGMQLPDAGDERERILAWIRAHD